MRRPPLSCTSPDVSLQQRLLHVGDFSPVYSILAPTEVGVFTRIAACIEFDRFTILAVPVRCSCTTGRPDQITWGATSQEIQGGPTRMDRRFPRMSHFTCCLCHFKPHGTLCACRIGSEWFGWTREIAMLGISWGVAFRRFQSAILLVGVLLLVGMPSMLGLFVRLCDCPIGVSALRRNIAPSIRRT